MDLKNEYVMGGDSYRVIAARHGLSYRKVRSLAIEENWQAARREHLASLRAASKTGASVVKSVSETLLRKVEQQVLEMGSAVPDLATVKQLTAILKDLRELQKSADENERNEVRVIFEGETEELAG